MMRVTACLGLAALLASAAYPQSPKPAFDIASVQVSPRATWAKTPANALQGGFLMGDRYELHRATMLDLIRLAYSIDADKIYGGPSWLDYDKFEVVAKTALRTRPETLRLMLQSLLEDRFHLSVKPDTKAMPAYLLTVVKDRSKLKPAEGAVASGCQQSAPQMGGDLPTLGIQCRGVTMDEFASALRRLAAAYFDNLPVVNSTGIDGAWDIDLRYPARVVRIAANGAAANDSGPGGLFESVEKDLGLKLERGNSPQPVLAVESVLQQPTPDPAGAAAALPPLPAPRFEVASIRPCDGSGPTLSPRFEAGGRVIMRCMPLISVLTQAFNLAPFEQPVGLPKWVDSASTKDNFSLEAKAPEGAFPDAINNQQARELLNQMLRGLLEDRYKLAAHFEGRPMDALTLVAGKPKLTKADPAGRTGCTRDNTPGSPTLKLVCRNITLAQFAEQIRAYDSNIFYPVEDATGIEGAWDFTLTYNLVLRLPPALLAARANAQAANPGEAADPDGTISFTQAIEKQLGLKLETHKRPEPVLVIDHMEEKPTEN